MAGRAGARNKQTIPAARRRARSADAAPLIVEVRRGPKAESLHIVHAVALDAAGRVVGRWGDAALAVFPRSAVKPIQALPLLETGAADAFGISDEELALACASHRGTPDHVRRVAAWLKRLGLDDAALECGPHAPTDPGAAAALLRSSQAPSTLHNNCSGKHAGILAHARHRGDPVAGYVEPGHPAQARLTAALGDLTGARLGAANRAIDGCSIPTFAIPLRALALGFARFADPARLAPSRAAAITRIRAAWGRYPELVSGPGTFTAGMMAALRGRALIKTGAEGVYVACLPAAGIGVALKAADGATRAAEVAVAELLCRLGALTRAEWRELAPLTHPPIVNWRGRTTGAIRPGK